MTVNVIIASVLHSVQRAINIKRSNLDSIAVSAVSWDDEARAILAALPTSPNVNLANRLLQAHGYTQSDLDVASAAISVMEGDQSLIEALVNNGDLSTFSSSEQPDPSIVGHILNQLNLTQPEESPAMTQTTTQSSSKITIDPGMQGAINALLNQATKGQLSDLAAILDMNVNLTDQLEQSRRDLANAVMKAQAVQVPSTGTVPSAQGDLTYDVVYRKANTVFPIANGKPSGKGLDFEIPTLVWKDSTGTVVNHPETPDVDVNYDFDGVKLLQSLTAINRGMNQWLFGHTGTGKSTFTEQVCAAMGWPLSRINLDSNLERADLVGHITLTESNGTTISTYEEGVLPRAMQRPGIFLMDEMDSGRPDILFVVQRALEGKGLMLTEDKGRIVAPHPLFRFVATANTRGQGDEYGMYAGTRAMNASMIDRFTAFIEFGYMKPDRESALLMKRVPSLQKPMADKMASFALEIRTAFSKGDIYNTISPRGLSVMAECYATFTSIGTPDGPALQLAMEMSTLNKATNDTRQKFIELATRVFGIKLK